MKPATQTERGVEVRAGYKRTDAGVIPVDWDVKQIAEIASVGSGGTPRREVAAYWGGSIPWVTTSQVDFGEITEADQFITDEGLQNSAAKLLPAGTLLMALYGQGKTRGKVGVLAMKAATNQACASISLGEGVSRDFVLHFLTSRYEQIRNSSNSGSQENLNGNIVKGTLIAFPPANEQRAIAAALSDVDALLGGLDRIIAKKRDLKQAAMQQLLTGQTRLPGFSGEWEVKRLGDAIAKLVGGGTPSRSNPAYWGEEVPWVTVKDFATFNPRHTQESITRVGLKNSASHLVPAGTLITSTRMALGKAVVYEVDVAINQDLKAVFLGPGSSVQFLYYWFQLNAHMINELGSGSTVKGISIAELKSLPFPLVDFPEQTAIAAVLSDMDAELSKLVARRDKTRDLKQAMMQELLTGRIRLV